MSAWHPTAKRVEHPDAGAFVKAEPKLVWHTTEGSSLPAYDGDSPHFTLNIKTGELYQHIPINRAAAALVHNGGVETNHAHAIQVELIGSAADSPNWTDAEYGHIADLARWVEHNAGVPRKCGVKFTSTPQRQATRLGESAWLSYGGHCGHEHVPDQAPSNHWDPGSMDIAKVLALPVKKIPFTRNEAHTLHLIMAERKRNLKGDSKVAKARRSLIRRCKLKIRFYRAKIRVVAALTGWNRSGRRDRYKGLIKVYNGGTVAL